MKCAHIFEEAAGDFGRQFERDGLSRPPDVVITAGDEVVEGDEMVKMRPDAIASLWSRSR
jgi:hypothetical protein